METATGIKIQTNILNLYEAHSTIKRIISAMPDQSSKTTIYEFHGLTLSKPNSSNQSTADCPFCGKENHLYINATTGQFDCKVCGQSGNQFSFLRLFLEHCPLLPQPGPIPDLDSLPVLSREKAIPPAILSIHRVRENPYTGHWLIPADNPKGSLANLYAWIPSINEIRSSPGCQHQLYLADQLSSISPSSRSNKNPDHLKPLYILEGFWDCMIFDHILRLLRLRSKVDILAAPGATTFKRDWIKFLSGRHVHLLFDNDEAGARGMSRIVNLCSQSTAQPKSIKILDWDSLLSRSLGQKWLSRFRELPSGFDIRDLYLCILKSLSKRPKYWSPAESTREEQSKAASRVYRIIQDALGLDSMRDSPSRKSKGRTGHPTSSKGRSSRNSHSSQSNKRKSAGAASRSSSSKSSLSASGIPMEKGYPLLPCPSFHALSQAFKSTIPYFPDSYVDALACTLAVVTSTLPQDDSIEPNNIDFDISKFSLSDPLWIYLVGPPGSGKTLIIEACSNNPFTKPISKITGLTSGMKQDSKDGLDETSPIHWFNLRTVLVKDYTYILSQPAQAQDNLFGEMRDAFDKKIRNYYRNGKLVNVNFCYFGLVCGVTDEIRAVDRATLGERFLAVEVLDDTHSTQSHIQSALFHANRHFYSPGNGEIHPDQVPNPHSFIEGNSNPPSEPAPESELSENQISISPKGIERPKAMIHGLLFVINARMLDPSFRYPTCPPEYLEKIGCLAEICGYLRSRVRRDKMGDAVFRPRMEIGSRLAGQLLKLGIALCIVYDKPVIDGDIYRIIHKVAFDTLDRRGYVFGIIQALHVFGRLTSKQLAYRVKCSDAHIKRTIKGLQELGIVCNPKPAGNEHASGRNSHYFILRQKIKTLWRACQ